MVTKLEKRQTRQLGKEQTWLRSDNAAPMLKFLLRDPWARPGPRKCQLFSLACCRRLGSLLKGKWWEAVDLMERYAAAQVELTSLRGAMVPLRSSRRYDSQLARWSMRIARDAVLAALDTHCRGRGELWSAAETARHACRAGAGKTEAAFQASLLRELIGNPYQRLRPIPEWRTVTIVDIARGIDADLAFDRMPILADALEEHGCDHADVLEHCRQPTGHVRGCWVVDMLLGKE